MYIPRYLALVLPNPNILFARRRPDQVPAIEPVTVGAVMVAFASPKVAETFDQLNNGVTLATETVIVTVPPDT